MSAPSEPMPRRPSEPGIQEKRADFWANITRRLVLTVVAAGILALLALNTYSVMLTRQTQVQNTPTLKSANAAATAAKATAELIAGCQVPGKPCFERNKALAGDTLKSSNKFTLYAVSCAQQSGVNTPELLKACVEKSLAADKQPQP